MINLAAFGWLFFGTLMPLPTSINDLSTTAANNYPAGSDAPSVLDDTLRQHASFIAGLRDTMVSTTGTQTLTNKTLTAPTIATITNGGTVTLPSGTDQLVGRATTDTLTNKTLTNPALIGSPVEDIYAITDGDSVDLSPANGSIQTWTLGASRTPVVPTAWTAGQAITLMINDGAGYTLTWTAVPVVWLSGGGAAPALATSGYTKVVLWKVGSVYYGAY